MRLFRTPNKSRRAWWLITLTILAAPWVVAGHFVIRLMRGDYPWNADAIGIPVFLYGMFVFPITLFFLVRGLRHYRADVFLFTWGSGHFLHILLWTLLAVCPVALGSIGMLIDSFEGRHYWVTAFFLLHCYCLLILRASIVTHASSSTDV